MKPTHKTFVFGLALGAVGVWLAVKGFQLPSLSSGDAPASAPAPGAK